MENRSFSVHVQVKSCGGFTWSFNSSSLNDDDEQEIMENLCVSDMIADRLSELSESLDLDGDPIEKIYLRFLY